MSMVEIVAQAVHPEAYGEYAAKMDLGPWQERARARARCVIAAMHEPTDAMMAAGLDLSGISRKALRLTYRAMMGAALTE